MPTDLFDFDVLRWRLPLLHARQLDDIAYQGLVSQNDDYDQFIADCQVVYRGAARTAELTRYLVLLVMFSRAAVEPITGRQAKMESIFHWATGEAPTTKGKAGRLGAALRISHFLFCHGQYMDACVLHRHFSLNSVIDCPKALLVDDRLLTRLLERLSVKRHDTTQVVELARRILREKGSPEAAQEVAVDPPQPVQAHLEAIKAVKEDGTYLVVLSNRSRCVSLTKEAIMVIDGGAAMLIAFSRSRAAGTSSQQQRKSSRPGTTVVEVCGRRGKQHQALLEGNTSRRWYSTAQLLLWKDGKTRVDDYNSLHPPTEEPIASVTSKDQTLYIDQVSKEPLTDPFTLESGGHRESYNLSSWHSLLNARHTSSPVLKAPIEFYQPDGLAVFVPQPDPALKAEVALWLLTPVGKAYAAEVDPPITDILEAVVAVAAPKMEPAKFPSETMDDIRAEAREPVTDGVSLGEHRLLSVAALKEADASTHRALEEKVTAISGSSSNDTETTANAPPASLSLPGVHDAHHHQLCGSEVLESSTAATIDSFTEARAGPSRSSEQSHAEIETLRAELERVKQQLKLASRLRPCTIAGAHGRPRLHSAQPAVERATLLKELRRAPMVDEATDFLNDNAIAYVLEALNHHNHLLHHHDQHAYCFDPQVVARAETGVGLRAPDVVAAEGARYWLLPRNKARCHWWLDVYDRFRCVLYRADSSPDLTQPLAQVDPLLLHLWPEDPPEVRHLAVRQQEDGVSCGDYVIQFAAIIASPGWHPDSGSLSKVLPGDRSQVLRQLQAGSWEIQRPLPKLAIDHGDSRHQAGMPQRVVLGKRSWVNGCCEVLPCPGDVEAAGSTESDSESLPDQLSFAFSDLSAPTTPSSTHTTPDHRSSKRVRPVTILEMSDPRWAQQP